ncbi:hypothetical protein CSE16_20235 [Solibacillus sp. R5-41]|uniref:hypothetical protein n=1 Tax=Solibacillus sp. R5-41 TaxID=2048654 RepID=UPI000C124FA8|nr:hypothetical protein [Solibacillus sp. R5-41]ATP42152.1 hypothetical protein CSE16_20235 [Solibacillus sp. R5-41]
MKKKLSIFLLLTILVCGIFSFSNSSYAVTQVKELKDDYHSTEVQTETILDFQGISYLTTKEYLHTPSGLPIYKTEVYYADFHEVKQQPEFFEFTKDVEGHLYKGTLELYQAEMEDDGRWKAMYSGVISTEVQTETILDFQGISYLTTKEYLHTPSGLPIYKTEVYYADFHEVKQQPEFFEFTKDVEGHLYKGTLELYQAEMEDDGRWKAMYSGVISKVESSNE